MGIFCILCAILFFRGIGNGDRFRGNVKGEDRNGPGKILMKVREELREEV